MTVTTKNAPTSCANSGEGYDDHPITQEGEEVMSKSTDTSTPQYQQPPGWAVAQARAELDPHEYGGYAEEYVMSRAREIAAAAAVDATPQPEPPAPTWADRSYVLTYPAINDTWEAVARKTILDENDIPVTVEVVAEYTWDEGAEQWPEHDQVTIWITERGNEETILNHPDEARAVAAALIQASDLLARLKGGAFE